MKLSIPRVTVDDDLGLLIREGFVTRDRTGSDGRERFRLTEAGRSQAESIAARMPIANLRTGLVSSPSSSGGGSPELVRGQNNLQELWAGNLVFDPRSIRRPAGLRPTAPNHRFYRPTREGKDSSWMDDSTTPEEEYQRRYMWIQVPQVVSVGDDENSKRRCLSPIKKSKKRKTVVEAVCQPVESPFYSEDNGDDDDSEKTVDMYPPALTTSPFEGLGQLGMPTNVRLCIVGFRLSGISRI
jgi:DNA-binding PadR family transcriptional regulator